MRSAFLTKLAALAFIVAAIAAHGQINPATQITWPNLTGSGAPALLCQPTFTGSGTAAYGQLYIDTSSNPNAPYICGSHGWQAYNAGSVVGLTTTGTAGAATLGGGVMNIPQYQGQITLTTTGSGGAATFSGNTLNIPQYVPFCAQPGPCSISGTMTAPLFSGSISGATGTFSGQVSGASLPTSYSMVTCGGDSTAYGVGDTSGQHGDCGMFSAQIGYLMNNQGVGGQSSTEVRARLDPGGQAVTVSGNAIPAGPSCSVPMTWDDTAYSAPFNSNTVAPSTSQAPSPYNNSNGTTIGGQWISIQDVEGNVVDGFWTAGPPGFWTYNHVYTFTPATCPGSPVSVPAHSIATPLLFTWPNSLYTLTMGVNNISAVGGAAQVEADFDAVIATIPGTNPNKRLIIDAVWYESKWQVGSASANAVLAANTYLQTNYGTYWPIVNGKNMLQYLASLYDPANLVDVWEQTWNPLLVPSSLRAYYANKGTLTSAIGDITTCTFSVSDTTQYEYLLVDTEKIRVITQAGGNISACERGFAGTTAAAHLNGAAFGAQDMVHPNTAGYQAKANFKQAWFNLNPSLGGLLVNSISMGNTVANLSTSKYTRPDFQNIFTVNQKLGPASSATSSTTLVNSPFLLYDSSAWDPSALGGTGNDVTSEYTTLNQAVALGDYREVHALGLPASTIPYWLWSNTNGGHSPGKFEFFNGTPATVGAPSYPSTFRMTGKCWKVADSSSQSSTWVMSYTDNGTTIGLDFTNTNNCAEAKQLTLNSVALATYPGVGIPNSTGSAWGTSYTAGGSGTVIPTESGTYTSGHHVCYSGTAGAQVDCGAASTPSYAMTLAGSTTLGTSSSYGGNQGTPMPASTLTAAELTLSVNAVGCSTYPILSVCSAASSSTCYAHAQIAAGTSTYAMVIDTAAIPAATSLRQYISTAAVGCSTNATGIGVVLSYTQP